jgi:hypothetical protein
VYTANALDTSNDYSQQGSTTDYSLTENIPIYIDGKIVEGVEPGGGSATPPPSPLPGDDHCSINIVDALLIAQYYVGLISCAVHYLFTMRDHNME